MRKNKGFTLIELLVVIAIIGILASIVLVSLSGARNKAKEAKIKADLTQVRSIAEMIYNDNSNYATLCSGTTSLNIGQNTYGTQLTNLNADIKGAGGTTIMCNAPAAGTSYCVHSSLPTTGNACVDSGGKVGAYSCNTTPACD